MHDRAEAHRFILSEIVSLESLGDRIALTLRDEKGGSVRLHLPRALATALREQLDAVIEGTDEPASDPGSI